MEKKVLYRPWIGKIDFYVNVQNDKIMYIVDIVMDEKFFVYVCVREMKAPESKMIRIIWMISYPFLRWFIQFHLMQICITWLSTYALKTWDSLLTEIISNQIYKLNVPLEYGIKIIRLWVSCRNIFYTIRKQLLLLTFLQLFINLER